MGYMFAYCKLLNNIEVSGFGRFDVDDIFLNALGGFVGFLIYYTTKHIFNKKIIPYINQNQ